MSDAPTPVVVDGIELTPEQATAREKFLAQQNGIPNPEGDLEAIAGGDKPQKPDDVPDKYWDAEKGEVRLADVLKANAELEKKLGSGVKPATEQQSTGDEAKQAEFNELRSKTTEKLLAGQSLDDADYEAWKKHGFESVDVDMHISGLKAIAKLRSIELHSEAGGEAQYKDMVDWARTVYTPAEAELFNRDVHSDNDEAAKSAVRNLVARYKQANGVRGRDITNSGAGRSADGYLNREEMLADMKKPEYSKSSTFRAEVARKVQNARANGVNLSS